jgi:hypothetical protein
MYNLEHIFTSVPRPPQNVLFSDFGDLVTVYKTHKYKLSVTDYDGWDI